jgi:hypothetical protein
MVRPVSVFLRHCSYRLIQFITGLFPRGNQAGFDVVIVKPDALGDFTIFSTFLGCLLVNEYAQKKVLFIGNVACKNLATAFDFPSNLDFFWVDRKRFNRSPLYRFYKVLELRKINCRLLICPIYGCDQFVTEYIVRAIPSPSKLTMRGDSIPAPASQHSEVYTKKFPPLSGYPFESDSHRHFLSQVHVTHALRTVKAAPIKPADFSAFDLPSLYYVVFIGASDPRRRWSVNNFIELCDRLEGVYQGTPVFCGSKEDADRVLQLGVSHLIRGINIVGKTTMAQLVTIIGKADFLVSNESCAPHIAYVSACNNSYVISNGNHLGRFCPYPDGLYPGYSLILPPEVLEIAVDRKGRDELYSNGSSADIDKVCVAHVFNEIMESLNGPSQI